MRRNGSGPRGRRVRRAGGPRPRASLQLPPQRAQLTITGAAPELARGAVVVGVHRYPQQQQLGLVAPRPLAGCAGAVEGVDQTQQGLRRAPWPRRSAHRTPIVPSLRQHRVARSADGVLAHLARHHAGRRGSLVAHGAGVLVVAVGGRCRGGGRRQHARNRIHVTGTNVADLDCCCCSRCLRGSLLQAGSPGTLPFCVRM